MFATIRLAADSAEDATARLQACGPSGQASRLCKWVFDATHNETLAGIAQDIARPLKATLIIVGAWLLTRVMRVLIKRVVRRLASEKTVERIGVVKRRTGLAILDTTSTEIPTQRRVQRAETIGAVLRSVSTFTIWFVAVIWALDTIGVALAPLIAGAGVAGLAIAFGAQSMIRDFLAGTFIVLEDQYGVGDVVDVGAVVGTPGTNGTVESVTLRATRIRDVEGVVWHVPNGEIRRVGNKSQQWSRVVLDVAVARDSDIDAATTVIRDVALEMWRSEEWQTIILDEPDVWGVEALGATELKIRLVVKTVPLEQWRVARELRARIKVALEQAGIDAPPAG